MNSSALIWGVIFTISTLQGGSQAPTEQLQANVHGIITDESGGRIAAASITYSPVKAMRTWCKSRKMEGTKFS